MHMSSTIRADDSENSSGLRSWLTETILEDDADGEMFIIAPTENVLYELGRIPVDADIHDRSVTVLLSETLLRDTRRNFPIASRLAGLPDTFSFHKIEADDDFSLPALTLVSSEFKLQALVELDGEYKQLSTDTEETSIESFKFYRQLAEDRPDEGFWTPSRAHIYETLEAKFESEEYEGVSGTDVANDFEEILTRLEESDEIALTDISADTIAVLVAAKYQLPNYDISKWVDDIGLVSSATLSRRKKAFDDRGYINTTKIQIDVGRPRQRLHLAEHVDPSIEGLVDLVIESSEWTLQ